ncbi:MULTISPECIES: lytic murein transglycosylase B [Ramlibacter]|uniref:Lytic murein transglycosylase B n=1 Tax=Ramlibacter aquaticus TaxID=2780094 RepID=A0ABR9SE01_9BURK|nr:MULTISPECIES: lytic murein transglycosylase B [Ramlibacter]MBE7940588.1 lytic murein transglycosylase B [Ramlibacter aquaticus]
MHYLPDRRRLLAALLATSAGAALAGPQRRGASASQPARAQAARKTASAAGPAYGDNPLAMAWATDTAIRLGLDPAWTQAAIAQARLQPTVVRLMQPAPPGTAKNWHAYRARFIEPIRIAAGLRFWQDNREALARAEQRYGVPAELVVGIVGVETLYGRYTGNFRVLDALATLAFDFPPSHPRAAERSAYFRQELETFLVLQARAGADPTQPLGSYAGAMGLPQFMPSSLARWAVDFDGDGHIDLDRSAADVIGSVAHYFQAFGWVPGLPAWYPVRLLPGADLEALLAPDILPTFTVPAFLARGAQLEGPALQHTGLLALVELQNGDQPPVYVAGTENFYAVTRYNWSSYYAMAVLELGQEVRRALPPA